MTPGLALAQGGRSTSRRPCGPLPAGSLRGTRRAGPRSARHLCMQPPLLSAHGFLPAVMARRDGGMGDGGFSRFGVPTPGPLVSPHLELSPLLLCLDRLMWTRGQGSPRHSQTPPEKTEGTVVPASWSGSRHMASSPPLLSEPQPHELMPPCPTACQHSVLIPWDL